MSTVKLMFYLTFCILEKLKNKVFAKLSQDTEYMRSS